MFNDLDQQNLILDSAAPEEILHWAWKNFAPDLVASSSFQIQSLPLLHMLSLTVPDIPILFIDTGFHFKETLRFRDRLAAKFNLNLEIVKPDWDTDDFLKNYGDLYRTQPDTCCFLNKTEPLQQALNGKKAWISGIRRDQTASRTKSPIISHHPFRSLYKINPMAKWSHQEINDYIKKHNLPSHPLGNYGFLSIGCYPCTTPVQNGEDPRAGRWRGFAKNECGIHFP